MKVVYIAGKYRGPNAWAVEQNIRAAEEVAARVWAMGLVALCPHANARHMLEDVCSEEHALAGTLELMRRCDAVVLVPGWGTSVGTRGEVEEAQRMGLPIFGMDDPYITKTDPSPNHYNVSVGRTLRKLDLWRTDQAETAAE